MSKTIIIAEKPSVAQDIVRALTPVSGKFEKEADHFENDAYVVTSAVGHLVEIKAPEEYDVKRGKWSFAHLPVVPPHFDLAPIDKAKSRLNAVVKLVKRKDVTQLINACDAGREGELIFRLIVQYAGGEKKPIDKPIRRLWLQSMTPQAIRDGFEQLRSDEQMQGLADAARSRSEADWLVGINGTRAMTAFNSRDGGFFLTTVGRVQTPTLSIVVEREEKIRKHVARDYWEVRATFDAQAGQYDGKWFDPAWKKNPDDPELRNDRLWDAAAAQAIADAVRGQPASVSEESKPTTSSCPALYDLTTLQREANSRFGFSRQDHAVDRPGAVREAQGADLPAHRLARAARGLRGGGEEHLRDDRQGRPAGPAAAAGRACQAGLEGRLRQAAEARVRQRQGVGPLRHHPDAAAAEEPERDRGQALRPGGQALPGGVLSAGRVHGDDAHLHRQGRRQGAQVPDQRQGAGQARLAGGVRQGGAGGRRQPGGGGPGRDGAHRKRRRGGAEDQAAGALHRSHAADRRWKARAS